MLAIHDLQHIVSVDATPPVATLSSGDVNPTFLLWMKTNRLVLSWMKATVSSFIQTMLLPCKTTQEAWSLLDCRLSPYSKIHVRSVRDLLRSLWKTVDQSMMDYLLLAKSYFDSLFATSSPIPDLDFIDFIVNGLGINEYKEFITSVHFCPSTTFDEIFELLIQEESLMKCLTSPRSMSAALTASTSQVVLLRPLLALSQYPTTPITAIPFEVVEEVAIRGVDVAAVVAAVFLSTFRVLIFLVVLSFLVVGVLLILSLNHHCCPLVRPSATI